MNISKNISEKKIKYGTIRLGGGNKLKTLIIKNRLICYPIKATKKNIQNYNIIQFTLLWMIIIPTKQTSSNHRKLSFKTMMIVKMVTLQ